MKTGEWEQYLKAAQARGLTAYDAAEEIGCEVQTVWSYCRLHGIDLVKRPRQRHQHFDWATGLKAYEGKTINEAVAGLHYGKSYIKAKAREYGIKFRRKTKDDI